MMDLVPRRPVEFSIRSSPAHLPVVRVAIEKMCQMLGFDEDPAGAVMLSVDEALTNIIKHAYDGDNNQTINIELAPLGDDKPEGIRVRLRDWGRQASPGEIKSRELHDVRPGGLGVHIMTECMDHIEFEVQDDGGTLLTMIKNIEPKDSTNCKGQEDSP